MIEIREWIRAIELWVVRAVIFSLCFLIFLAGVLLLVKWIGGA